MKKQFDLPEIEIIMFGCNSILTASGNDELPDDNPDEL